MLLELIKETFPSRAQGVTSLAHMERSKKTLAGQCFNTYYSPNVRMNMRG